MTVTAPSRAPAAVPDEPLVGRPRRPERLPRALGWTSAALVVPQLLRPAAVARAVGVGAGPRQRALATAVGARELVSAAGLLSGTRPRLWSWTRVAGDAMDLTVLTRALRHHDGSGRGRTAAATAAVAGIAAVDLWSAVRCRRPEGEGGVEITGTTTVRRDTAEVYAFWRRLDTLPSFMAHVDAVTVSSPGRSHWRVTAPFGRTVEWDAVLTEDVPGERLAWRTVEGADVESAGTVAFTPAPGGRGTEVHVRLRYAAPGGALGRALARYAGEEPRQMLDDDLRRLKQVLETGEVVRSDGAPGGKRARHEFPQHPAQPLSPRELGTHRRRGASR